MGVYELQEEVVNGFPLYKKAEETHYIYRDSVTLVWAVAEERAHVDGGVAWITTTSGADWYICDGKEWAHDEEVSLQLLEAEEKA